MKRKSSIFLTVSMIVLCVCAIAFGIYAAQQVHLNISGNLGFAAHNAFVSVKGTIKNVAKIENDNVVSKTDMPIDKIVKSADTAEPVDISMPLGDMYFYSSNNNVSAEDIVFELTFTNLGETDVLATITKPTVATSVSVVDNSDGDHSLYISFGETGTHQVGIYKGESQTISFAMHLKDMSNLSSKVSFNIPINFEEWIYKIGVTVNKFTSPDQSSIRSNVFSGKLSGTDSSILCYAERFPYYVEMGTEAATGAKLRWLIVGRMDENDSISALTTADTDIFAQGLMPKENNYCLVSELALYVKSATEGMVFQNAYKDTTKINTNYGVNANDYATSTTREFLKGKSVYSSAKMDSNKINYMEDTSIEKKNINDLYGIMNDALYSRIQARTLDSLYKGMANDGTNISLPTSEINTIDNTPDKLWLLSNSEFTTIFPKENNIHYSAATKLQGAPTSMNEEWRTRTPVSTDNSKVYGFGSSGLGYGSPVADYGAYYIFAVRPAFKI